MKSIVCLTGATGGLGKAFFMECASRRYDMVITDMDEEKLEQVAKAAETLYGINVYHKACDLLDQESIKEFFAWIDEKNLRIWSLINVAGVDFEGAFCERTGAQVRNMVSINSVAALEFTKYALERKANDRAQRIINISSLAAFYPMPLKATYAASKRLLLDFSIALHEEIRSAGDSVTCVCPSGLRTTSDSSEKIDAQGFWGRATTVPTDKVAKKSLDMALKGKNVYIPGAASMFLRILGSLAPRKMVAQVVMKRWRRAEKLLAVASQ